MILVIGALELRIADLLQCAFQCFIFVSTLRIMVYINLLSTEYELIHLRVKLFFKSAFSGSDSIFRSPHALGNR